MTKEDKQLKDLIKTGQSGKYKHFVRQFTGHITQLLKLRNPLDGRILVDQIETVLEVMNPNLKDEVQWFTELKSALKLWVNEKVATNRILGVKNENTYDLRVFEKVVMEKFFLLEKPSATAVIQTDFNTMVEMVELGARRFGH